MPWLKINNNLLEHPKFQGIGSDAVVLWFEGLCYAHRNMTDGHIPSRALTRLGANIKNTTSAASKLVDAKLWEQTEDGYQVHNYLEYQESRSDIEERRASGRKRQSHFRSRRSPKDAAAHTGPPTLPPEDATLPLDEAPPVPPDYETDLLQSLSSLPGWNIEEQELLSWLESKGISIPYAEITANSLIAQWGREDWKYKNPMATFKTWVQRPPLNKDSRNGYKPNETSTRDTDPYSEESKRLAEHRRRSQA